MDVHAIVKPVLVEGLTRVVDWYRSNSNYYLRSIFDIVGFKDRHPDDPIYLAPPFSVSSAMSYPTCNGVQIFEKERKRVLSEIDAQFQGLSASYLSSLNSNQLFFLLEKFGANVPVNVDGVDAIYDEYKVKAARHLMLWNQENLGHEGALLINIDLSGIQTFIYNVVAAGALKNLRARSFFIDLLSCHATKQVLDAFHLHPVNVLMDGGGSVYIISSCPTDYEDILHGGIAYRLNTWLLETFGARLYAAYSEIQCSDADLDTGLSHLLKRLNEKAFKNKRSKFKQLIDTDRFPFIDDRDPVYPGCEICQRDDPGAGIRPVGEGSDRHRCRLCDQLVGIGNKIPTARYVYSCPTHTQGCVLIQDSYYLLSEELRKDIPCLWLIHQEQPDFLLRIGNEAKPLSGRVYTTRVSDLPASVRNGLRERTDELRKERSHASDYALKSLIDDELDSLRDENIATVEHLAAASRGAKLVAALRMDADNIGKLVHDGFYGEVSLPKLSSFSRNMNYFFKSHLTALCENNGHSAGQTSKEKGKRRSVQVIYAGGDDLFLVGAWSDVAELAVDAGKAFSAYTCGNLDFGLSAGLTLHQPQFPVNKMAENTKLALNTAKESLSACWMCRKDWVGCPLYDSGTCLRKDSFALFFTEHMASLKRKLDEAQRAPRYQQEPARLKLAVKWKLYDVTSKEVIDEVSESVVKPLAAFVKGREKLGGGFFQNALALLNTWYEEGMLYLPRMAWMIQKVSNDLRKMAIGPDNEQSLLELYETYLRVQETGFATLHMPLWWSILLSKGVTSDDRKINGGEAL
jgi:CRISPR-associated protein Csm1